MYENWTIDPEKTAIVVYNYPHGMENSNLSDWFLFNFRVLHYRKEPFHEPNGKITRINASDIICARNKAFNYAVNSLGHFEWVIFSDNDVIPNNESTLEMFKLTTDIKCCKIDREGPYSWPEPISFHDCLWCIKIKDLARVPEPRYETPEYNETFTAINNCSCTTFRDKALKAGLTIGNAGYAQHREGSSQGH